MWLEGLPRFKQRLQTRKDPWPSIGTGSISRIILGPLVVRHRYFGRFCLRHQLDRCARRLVVLAHSERVLKDFRRLKPQDLPSNKRHALAIGPGTHPCERATWLEVRLKLSACEDDVVRFLRNKAFPHLLRRRGNVENIFERRLMTHKC